MIIFSDSGQLKRVSAAGGTASLLTLPNPSQPERDQSSPIFLSDGDHFLYWSDPGPLEGKGMYIGSLSAKPEKQGSKRLLDTPFVPVYVPSQDSGPGQLVFLRERTLLAQRFDDKRLELIGEPVPVAEQVGSFSAATNGVLVYRRGSPGNAGTISQAMWFDRQGKALGTVGEPGTVFGLALSPDGTRAAVGLGYSLQGSIDLWLIEFARRTNTRFRFEQGNNVSPTWSPEGNSIIYAWTFGGGAVNLYQKPATGAKNEELLLKSSEDKFPTSWSRDGRFLLYSALDPKTKDDLWVLPLEGDRKPIPYLRTDFNEWDGHFSPDMRWVAYTSDESGSNEIYVRGFSQTSAASSDAGGKWLVSKGGGTGPRWRGDGKELYYRAPDGKVMAVEITAGTVLQAGTPKPLFQASPDMTIMPIPLPSWDVTPDGKRFLLSIPAAEATPTPFTVVLNWTALLKK